MLVLACLKHWYASLIFFGPVPIVGFWVWFSGRRKGQDSARGTVPPGAGPRGT